MKKLVCVIACIMVATSIFTGCNNDERDTLSTASQAQSSVDPNKEEAVSEGSVSSTESSSVGESVSVEVDTGESSNKRLGEIIDKARPDEDTESFPAETDNENGGLDILGLTEEDVSEYAMAYSLMNVHAYGVAIIKPAEGKDEVVSSALKEYNDKMINNFENYLPDQLAIAENAIIEYQDGYYIFVMCDGCEDVADSIEYSLLNEESSNTSISDDVASSELSSESSSNSGEEAR